MMKFLESFKQFKNEDPRGNQIFNNDLTQQEVVDKDKGILTQDDGSKRKPVKKYVDEFEDHESERS